MWGSRVKDRSGLEWEGMRRWHRPRCRLGSHALQQPPWKKVVKSILQKCPAVQRRAAGRELSLSEVDDAEDQTSDEADDGNTPLPAEAVLDVVLDLDTGQTDAQIGSGSHRADEGGAVAADDHGDGNVSRVDAELVANTDQDGQQTVEVRVGIEQQSQRHAQDADDDGQETAQRGGDDVGHHNGHLLHDAALAQDTEEDAGTHNGGGHGQAGSRMALDDGVLQLLAAVVDQNAQSAANHEDIVRGEDIHDQDDDDGQGQDHIEDKVLRASQLIVLLFAIRIIVLAGILYGSIAQLGNALLLLEAPEDGSADGKDQADDLHRNDLTPQVIGLNA